MSPSIRRSALLLTGAAGAALLASCSSTSTSEACFPKPPELPSPAKKIHTSKITPAKARSGARPLHYFIVEISVPDRGREDSIITRHLSASQKKSGVTPHDIRATLHELSQTKGVDLMSVGTAREGQTLHTNFARSFRYADDFTPAGQPKSYTTARTGVKSAFSGEFEKHGTYISVDGSLDINEFTGFSKQRLPSGPEVLQPVFNKRAAHFQMLIPDGGVALLDGLVRSDAERIEDRHLGGLIRTKSERIIHRYLAIGVTSEPLSSSTAKPSTPKTIASGG